MNKAKLKTYAPQARKDFIAAVTARANRIGLAEKNGTLAIAPAEKNGDFVIIAGQSWPAKISRQRDALLARIDKDGFSQTLEAVAYTWFNRFAALRYMEIHDYLSHGYRALSSRDGGLPELLNAAAELAQNGGLPDLNAEQAIALKLAGDKDGELYRLALIAQCNALAKAMPFLFERIDNESELLLPDNLLLTDSVIAKLVAAIPEQDWQDIEIIGWLYQFYISEKKDQVIGKVVKSEDIPAATQLFTPNWIVKYLVQNSVGRLWTMANPESTLKNEWAYYIEPAEQTPEVQTQLDALIQSRRAEDGGSLNPETITVLDPACGSGHILVEAYAVLKAIYLERGYPLRSIPRLILEKNLYGLDIDDRAAQLAGFALLMKARADDRRLLDNPPQLNVLAIQASNNLNLPLLWQQLDLNRQSQLGTTSSLFADPQTDLTQAIDDSQYRLIKNTLALFEQAETFGALIQIPAGYAEPLQDLLAQCQTLASQGDSFQKTAATTLLPFIRQASVLAMQFDVVVANPPYMGGKGMNPALKEFAKRKFPDSKSDLFAMFMECGFQWCKSSGFNAMVTMQSWMFLSSFEEMRKKLLVSRTISNLVQVGYNSFPEMNSKIAQACVFSVIATHINNFTGRYIDLNSAPQSADKNQVFLGHTKELIHDVCQDNFKKISGSPVAYWVSDKVRFIFENKNIGELANTRKGMVTANNDLFVRTWSEIAISNFCSEANDREFAINSGKKWFPYIMGGEYRKWFGNRNEVVNWKNDGVDIQTKMHPVENRVWATNFNLDFIFKKNINWNSITSSKLSFRASPGGELFASTGLSCFTEDDNFFSILGFLNSKVSGVLLAILAPTLSTNPGDIARLPISKLNENLENEQNQLVKNAILIAITDWNNFETSWDFTDNPLIRQKQNFVGWVSDSVTQQTEATDVGLRDKAANPTYASNNLELCFNQWQTQNCNAIAEMQRLEEENNRLFIEAYGLQDELSPDVPEEQITLTRADREKDSQRLVSYAVGCMMGRYSLDAPGLIYAHAGNIRFDPDRYPSFPADADGIVPITDELWFEDDAANRLNEFLLAVWGADTQDENLAWLAASLGQKPTETAQETIRRYLAGSFYKNHLQTYKKRPIYWLFSSGKHGAFQALVYLHRYHEGTLSRMRTEYVVPLTGKLQSRLDMLEKDAAAAVANATRSKLNKDSERLRKKHLELLAYDEKLRHYADLRIALDLDEGVKVNYGKFGDLLAEVKTVTGSAND
ncbi:BREX-1 system adenine-specific DNA-methyltransferase PglX [Methylovulum psychrotolerans]|uniref:site-specific DNA-methyltransferase (adenine-specific) n=1 Tax=Methylovulum psychrotolerans TaxID=1704499 RepID=A0A1Z4BYP1_9GAMM|nr:BREX-1 system adenine-specific DNA-methyltransferase PglX [Methylovulum psychrotolerans]ASF46372.1 SAM-dependent methyltransferase [Methylovulum psychrotolerans]